MTTRPTVPSSSALDRLDEKIAETIFVRQDWQMFLSPHTLRACSVLAARPRPSRPDNFPPNKAS